MNSILDMPSTLDQETWFKIWFEKRKKALYDHAKRLTDFANGRIPNGS